MMPLQRALQIAQERGFDLVAIAPKATPPVCRVLDYGKYKYEQTKKERKAKQGQKATLLREVRFRPRIDEHDLQVKIEKAKELLEGGNKVRIWLRFRGREIIYPEHGWKVLQKVAETLKEIATVSNPINDSRNIALVLTPAFKNQKSKVKGQEAKTNAKTQNSQRS